MNKIPTVTIGIPAYNEARNIKSLLLKLLNQKQKNFLLNEIVVVCDGSSDGTVDAVKSIKSNITKLIRNPARCGQIYCQNVIFTKAESDIVVILEADTIPATDLYLINLLNPLIKDTGVGYIQGNATPSASRNLLGSVLGAQQEIYLQLCVRYGKGIYWLCSGRGGRAFSKKVYKSLMWPPNVPEDAFAYLWCQSKSIKTLFVKEAICLFQEPKNLNDLIKQRQKTKSGIHSLSLYFPKEMIDQIYHRPMFLKFLMSLRFLNHYPIYFFIYLQITLLLKFKLNNSEFTDRWVIAHSTKQIIFS